MTHPLTRSFAANNRGRDFVVGDIHGQFTALERLLERVGFQAGDRLFCVGDLIDRGPESLRALEFLARENFFAVRGNHEDLLLSALAGNSRRFDLWQQTGGRWAQFADPAQLEQLRQRLATLPLALEINRPGGRIGIVHADWPGDDWDRVFLALNGRRPSKRLIQTLLWSRERWRRLELERLNPGLMGGNRVSGVATIYVGHSPVSQVCQLGSFTFLDTGAGHGGRLSLVEIGSGRAVSLAVPGAEY